MGGTGQVPPEVCETPYAKGIISQVKSGMRQPNPEPIRRETNVFRKRMPLVLIIVSRGIK